MEPRIQYAKTSDGVNIAFSSRGQGKPVVIMPTVPMVSMQMAWTLPEFRRRGDLLRDIRTIVTYDSRGFGFSDRNAAEFTIDTLMLDLEAVADKLGLQTFDLVATFNVVPAAITFAACNPDRVERLVLLAPFADGAKFVSKPVYSAFFAMRQADWDSYVQVMARQVSADPRAQPCSPNRRQRRPSTHS